MTEQPIDAQKLTKEIIEAEAALRAMGNTPKSECKCIDLPELETLSYKPPKSSRATEEETTPIIEPEMKGKNSEVAGQHFEQPNTPEEVIDKLFPIQPERKEGHNKLVYDKESRTIIVVDPHPEQSLKQPSPLETVDSFASSGTEQPNTELLIVKTIQGLTTCISNELEKLVVLRGCMPINNMMVVIDQALEDIDSFEKIMLELQKAFK